MKLKMKLKLQKTLKNNKKNNKHKIKTMKGGSNLVPITNHSVKLPDESKIVIICHSRTLHSKLLYIDKHNNIIQELGEKVRFIDPKDKANTWESIDKNTIKYIWGICCPIYTIFFMTKEEIEENMKEEINTNNKRHSKIINSIFKTVYDILNSSSDYLVKNGKVIFGYDNTNINQSRIDNKLRTPFELRKQKIKNIIEKPNYKLKNKWLVTFQDSNTFDFNICKETDNMRVPGYNGTKGKPQPYLIIFSKGLPNDNYDDHDHDHDFEEITRNNANNASVTHRPHTQYRSVMSRFKNLFSLS